MRVLLNNEVNIVAGAIASMSGDFSFGPQGVVFGSNFTMTVTGKSSNSLGSFKVYSDKVIDGSTNTVIFDGSQDSFCYKGFSFQATPIADGHIYKYIGTC